MSIAFIQNLNAWEITLIALVFLLLFGAKRLPDLARGIGKSIREFKKATSEAEETFRSAMAEDPKDEPAPAKKQSAPSSEPTSANKPADSGPTTPSA